PTGRYRMSAVRPCRFFFQAEDGIRDLIVTGVQTCALPIFPAAAPPSDRLSPRDGRAASRRSLRLRRAKPPSPQTSTDRAGSTRKIGRASCRERVEMPEGGVIEKKENERGGRRRLGATGRPK